MNTITTIATRTTDDGNHYRLLHDPKSNVFTLDSTGTPHTGLFSFPPQRDLLTRCEAACWAVIYMDRDLAIRNFPEIAQAIDRVTGTESIDFYHSIRLVLRGWKIDNNGRIAIDAEGNALLANDFG